MKKDPFVPRAELVTELLAGLPMPVAAAVDATTCDIAVVGTLAPPDRDAFVSRKLAIAREILLRDLSTEMAARSILNSPEAVRDWLRLRCAEIEHEVFFLLHLDARNRLIKAEEIFRGTLTHTSVNPREVVRSALAHNAASVMLAHNHPGGDTQPSQADRLVTRTLASALSLVDVRLADHFIVAGNSILSFAEQGFL